MTGTRAFIAGPDALRENASQLPGSDKWLYADPVYTEILPS